jgi:hypothetical protein
MRCRLSIGNFGCILLLLFILSQGSVAWAQLKQKPDPYVDSAGYHRLLNRLANQDKTGRWPVNAPRPLKGALLPYHRIVAYYGNLYSQHMGVLGQYPKAEMLRRLEQECAAWRKADSLTPVLPALHYIAVTAQGLPGKDGKYRYRMPDREKDKIVQWAREIKGIAFMDIQVGHSTLQDELPHLEKYLKMPDVHLGIDPEYSMKNGDVPCHSIGTFDASDINVAVEYLAALVKKYQLPPKVLVVHRFTLNMITNYKAIKKVPEVQIVIDMDGFGSKALKLASYRQFLAREPIQFTGFKLFYKLDKPVMYAPAEILRLSPIPVYIQYQ